MMQTYTDAIFDEVIAEWRKNRDELVIMDSCDILIKRSVPISKFITLRLAINRTQKLLMFERFVINSSDTGFVVTHIVPLKEAK